MSASNKSPNPGVAGIQKVTNSLKAIGSNKSAEFEVPHPPPTASVSQGMSTPSVSQDGCRNQPNIPQAASASAVDNIDKVHGYENVTFDNAASPPPADNSNARGAPPQRNSSSSYPAVTDEEARDALQQFISEHCCYGSKAAKEMVFRSIENSSAFHYTLETFSEKRESSWVQVPYSGQHLDTPANGPAPLPWDIAASPKALFQDFKLELEVPHTASARVCHECSGIGRCRCIECLGVGQTICQSCNGTGHFGSSSHHHHPHHHHPHHHNQHHHHHHHDQHHRHHHGHHHNDSDCLFCHGEGRKRCNSCSGHGQVACKVCDTKGRLKCYIKLTVTWKNHLDDSIVEQTPLPSDLIRKVSGQLAFEEELSLVWPVNHFPDQKINAASSRLVEAHKNLYKMERILKQRHRVRIVPVAQIYTTWKGKDLDFFVYGFEKKVHCPNYPQKCCCGCTVL